MSWLRFDRPKLRSYIRNFVLEWGPPALRVSRLMDLLDLLSSLLLILVRSEGLLWLLLLFMNLILLNIPTGLKFVVLMNWMLQLNKMLKIILLFPIRWGSLFVLKFEDRF